VEATVNSVLSESVAKIEVELAEFWSTTTDDTGEFKARAATMNFVAASSADDVSRLRTAIDLLAETRAGRVFLIRVDDRLLPWQLDSDVGAVCHREGEGVVCYDRIELVLGALAASRVASVVRALTLHEVPTIVEVGKDAPTLLVEPLVAIADRVIVDSAHTRFSRIAELTRRASVPFADRAWVRTFLWRELTARFFDEMPEALPALHRIEVGRAKDQPWDPALLLVGWLVSRLGYRIESAAEAVDSRGQRITIALTDENVSGLGPGEIASVRILTELSGRPLELATERNPSARSVRWSVSGARTDVHEHALSQRDENWVLSKAIDATEGDAVYRDAVRAAAVLETKTLPQGARA
jgi:glucose-6-phosphate dehydrogenase assembly protein OpcA